MYFSEKVLIYKVCTDRSAIKALNKIGKRKLVIEKYRFSIIDVDEHMLLIDEIETVDVSMSC